MKRTSMKNVLVIILLTAILWVNINLSYKVESLQNQVNNLNSNFASQLSQMSANLSQFTYNINKQMQWISSSDYRVVGINEDYSELELEFTFTLNEKRGDELLYLVLTAEDNPEIRVPVSESSSLIYTVRVTASEKNYQVTLLGVGTEVSRNQELDTLYLQNFRDSLVQIEGEKLAERRSSKDETAEIEFYIAVSSEPRKGIRGIEDVVGPFEFAALTADIYVGLEYFDTIDLQNGEGFTPIDPQSSSYNRYEGVAEFGSNYLSVAGKYLITGENYQKYLKLMETEPDEGEVFPEAGEVYFLVTVVDIRGIEYQQIVGSHFYELVGDEIVLRY